MSLVRAWARELCGAAGAAVLAPAMMLAALALLALAGGFGTLGDLGQAVSGPSLPAVQAPTPSPHGVRSTRATSPAGSKLLAVVLPRSHGRGTPPAPGGGAAAPRATRPGGAGHLPQPLGWGGGSSLSSAGSSQPKPSPRRTVVDVVVGVGTSVTEQVPAPVGPLATKTLEAAGATLDRLLPVPAPGAGRRPFGPLAISQRP